jgi:hypothetical protein
MRTEFCSQSAGKLRIQLQRGYVRRPGEQHRGRETRARTNLQQALAQLGIPQRPRNSLFQRFSPLLRAAEPVMKSVQAASIVRVKSLLRGGAHHRFHGFARITGAGGATPISPALQRGPTAMGLSPLCEGMRGAQRSASYPATKELTSAAKAGFECSSNAGLKACSTRFSFIRLLRLIRLRWRVGACRIQVRRG